MEALERRDVSFELDPNAVPRDWVGGDAFQTTFLSALSLLFPEGERFFVDSVKQVLPALDAPLAADVAAFIGQEAMHGREHKAFNGLVEAHGHASAPHVDAWLRRFLRRVRRVLSPRSQLAVTCALEHFTAMLAESLLADSRMRDDVHDGVRALWLWHALEEAEHKSVAFDVYRATGGGTVRRLALMLLTTAVFFAVQGGVHARLLHERGLLFRPWRWGRGIVRLWIYPGFLTRLVPAYLAYFRPGFHPSDRDTDALLAKWRTLLFGPAGSLSTLRAA
ncbi:MAG TPA: metal-dependent hydrolase [Byssovorax sp.]